MEGSSTVWTDTAEATPAAWPEAGSHDASVLGGRTVGFGHLPRYREGNRHDLDPG